MSEYFDLPKLVLLQPWRMRTVQPMRQLRRDLKVEKLEGWKKRFCYTECSLVEKIPNLDLLDAQGKKNNSLLG